MPKRILIIDDEQDMRVYLKTLFRRAGYDVETAVNGEEALMQVEKVKPDLITLDILMPQKSGLNCYQSLRQDDHTRELPVIIVSGVTGHREFFDDKHPGGSTLFVEKPIEPDFLLQQVKELIGE